jgi:hypothetical protein
MKLTEEQQKAYDRFIKARNKVGLYRTGQKEYVPQRDYLDSVKPDGQLEPLFIVNEAWMEYKEASAAWWRIEPKIRHDERMRMSRGDYDSIDSWDEPSHHVKDIYSEIKK